MIKIAVMDSGSGGLAVLNILMKEFPFGCHFIYINDYENMPYGNKSKEQIKSLCYKNIEKSKKYGADIICVACNTMSTCCREVFEKYAKIPVYYVQPDSEKMLELGLENCLLFCTQQTAKSVAIRRLSNICSTLTMPMKTLAQDIEKNIFDLSKVKIFHDEKTFVQKPNIFLGCTHYLLLREKFKEIYKNSNFFGGYENILTKLKKEINDKENFRKKSTKSFIESGNLRAEKVYNTLYGSN